MDCLLWMTIASILVWPGILLNVAFQLSYGLTAIIIFLSKWQRAVLPRIRANLWVPIGMSLIALPSSVPVFLLLECTKYSFNCALFGVV